MNNKYCKGTRKKTKKKEKCFKRWIFEWIHFFQNCCSYHHFLCIINTVKWKKSWKRSYKQGRVSHLPRALSHLGSLRLGDLQWSLRCLTLAPPTTHPARLLDSYKGGFHYKLWSSSEGTETLLITASTFSLFFLILEK